MTITNGIREEFLSHFGAPRFASDYDENQLLVTDVSQKTNTL